MGRHGAGWEDQWARIMRWRERVRLSRDVGRTDGLGTEGYRDEVFALYQAVWHLKDWFKNDPALPASVRTSVEQWVADNGSRLKVAADVANGSKHLTQTTKQQRAGGSAQTRNDVHLILGDDIRALHTFYVDDARTGGDSEALLLGDECLDEWRSFLAQNRLAEPATPI
jgi:hypothetical protein